MSPLPPRARLARVVRSLTQHLPGQLEGLLDVPRFADGGQALLRLKDAAHLEAALAGLADADAAWLADTLLARWERVAPVRLEPEVAIVAPAEVWLGAEARRVPLTLSAEGLDPGFEAQWEGDVLVGPPSAKATLLAAPPPERGAAEARVRAHVRASAGGQRLLLIATARIALRRPAVLVSDDRRRLLVSDQAERPAVGVRLEVGDAAHVTGPGGQVELEAPVAPGAPLRVEGVAAGRVPTAKS